MTAIGKTHGSLQPIPATERIIELDVLRGVALIGILLINMEFFNRPLADSGDGLMPGLHGMDQVVAWLQYLLVRGKFWTLFSLLFGMGFAVMLDRARQSGRDWSGPYLRRIAALGLFGVLHHVLLWGGDILLSYAMAATGLIAILFVPLRGLLATVAALVLLGLVPRLQPLHLVALSVAIIALAAGLWRATAASTDISATRNTRPRALNSRALALGVALYVLPFVWLSSAAVDRAEAASAGPANVAVVTAATPVQTEAMLIEEGSYAQFVQFRFRRLVSSLPGDTLFMTSIVGVFLVGTWFVQSGLLRNARSQLPVFRRLAVFGVGIGLVLSLLSSSIATGRGSGLADDPFPVANSVMHVANLVMCVGYVGLIIVGLHGARSGGALRPMAPLGRMALTNYLMQSVVCSWVFYGYGLGLAGITLTAQVGFALMLLAAQVLVSHWWLARFRYGPMEWLWRALTYWQWPAWRARALPVGVPGD